MEWLKEVFVELFKHDNPLAWVIGVIAILFLALVFGKKIQTMTGKQGFTLMIVILFIILATFIADKLLNKPVINPIPQKQSLTIVLYEPGNKDMRPISDRGQIVLRDTMGHEIFEEVGFQGKARFDSLPEWVINSPYGVAVRLLASTVDSMYFLEEQFLRIKPNDTINLELTKLHIPEPAEVISSSLTTPVPNNQLRLQFVTEGGTTIVECFKYQTIQGLLEKLMRIARNEFKPNYRDTVYLAVNSIRVPENNMQKNLDSYGLKNNDEVRLGKIANSMLKATYPKVRFTIRGKQFNGSSIRPSIRLNGEQIEEFRFNALQKQLSFIGHIPNTQDSATVQIRIGKTFYNIKANVKNVNIVEIDISYNIGKNLKTNILRQKVLKIDR